MLLLSSDHTWTWQEHIQRKEKKKRKNSSSRASLKTDTVCIVERRENLTTTTAWTFEWRRIPPTPSTIATRPRLSSPALPCPAPTRPRLASPLLGSESRHWPKGSVASVDKDLVPDLSLRLLMPEIRHRANSQPVHQGKWASWESAARKGAPLLARKWTWQ